MGFLNSVGQGNLKVNIQYMSLTGIGLSDLETQHFRRSGFARKKWKTECHIFGFNGLFSKSIFSYEWFFFL